MTKPHKGAQRDRPAQEQHASPGDNSPSVTPKDVSADAATAQDLTERKTCSDNVDEQEEELLDDAVELTFPASDPIAIPSPETLQRHKASGKDA